MKEIYNSFRSNPHINKILESEQFPYSEKNNGTSYQNQYRHSRVSCLFTNNTRTIYRI